MATQDGPERAAVAAEGLDSAVAPEPSDAGVVVVPAADGGVGPLRIAVISDLNGSYGSTAYGSAVHQATARLVALAPDIVLVTGDMVAGQRSGLDYRGMWAGFHDAVTAPLRAAGIPIAVSPGNHDASGYASFQDERDIFVDEWRGDNRPALSFVDATHYPLRYSFEMGGTLFVSLDATTVGSLASEQMAWLETQLASVDAEVAKIVFGHMPLYPVAIGREDDSIGDSAFEALLNRYHVDAYVSGHHHAWYPGKRDALRLVNLSCLGSGARALIGTSDRSVRSFAWLEVEGRELARVDAFFGDAFSEVIPRSSLPESVGMGEWTIRRDDL